MSVLGKPPGLCDAPVAMKAQHREGLFRAVSMALVAAVFCYSWREEMGEGRQKLQRRGEKPGARNISQRIAWRCACQYVDRRYAGRNHV